MADEVYDGTKPVVWAELQVGDRIRIDNYEHGRYPLASPRLSGIYIVKDPKRRHVLLEGNKRRYKGPLILSGSYKLVRVL